MLLGFELKDNDFITYNVTVEINDYPNSHYTDRGHL